ncbi:MAG: hypothetical protein WC644_02810 [Ignavibacteria bacterium]
MEPIENSTNKMLWLKIAAGLVGKLLDYIRIFSFESDGKIDNFFNVYFAGFP